MNTPKIIEELLGFDVVQVGWREGGGYKLIREIFRTKTKVNSENDMDVYE